jgi:hypothetical protein
MSDAAQRRGQHGIDVRAVLWTGAAIVVTLVLAGIGAHVAWSAWRGQQAHEAPNAARDFRIAGPQLESAPRTERDAFMRDKETLLHSWGWVDPASGVAHIPVDEAMRILAERQQDETKRQR